jgi:hypothetical protein
MSLQQNFKRSISLKKPKDTVIETSGRSKSPGKTSTVASRLIQKRKSVERKIEEMRKQKFEAEMKEVQSKPKISSRSRKLAVRAEKKYLGSEKTHQKPQKVVKRYCDEELIELEEDIQLLESCLNMDKPKTIDIGYNTITNKPPAPYYFSTVDPRRPVKPDNKTPQRKFIKKISKKIGKQRSCSMSSLSQIQFGYRSLSPFQVSILKKNECD